MPSRLCPGISESAREFISESSCASWETVDLSPEGVRALREETSQVAKEGCDRIVNELSVKVHERDDLCVGVQIVTPRDVRGKEIVLFLFGGGFVSGCPEDDLSISARLAHFLQRIVYVPR